MKHYFLLVWGGVDISRSDEYDDAGERDEAAREAQGEDDENVVFWLDIDENGEPTVGEFDADFMDGCDEEG